MTIWINGPVRVIATLASTFTAFCDDCGELAVYSSETVAIAHCIRHVEAVVHES